MEENALNTSAAARAGRLRKGSYVIYDAKHRRIVEGKIDARLYAV
jgi:hypothetical protein